MDKTFDTVDTKIAEAEFFLQKMSEIDFDFFEMNCYFSAFLSATRSSTLALQQFNHLPSFEKWYKPHQKQLKTDKLARFFLSTRNAHIHGGNYPVTGGMFSKGIAKYNFHTPDKNYESQPKDDVVTTSREFFLNLLEIVFDCYLNLGVHIDPQQHFTKEHFNSLGKSIDHAEGELFGWLMSSLIEEGYTEDDRWHHLRGKVGKCEINHLFYSYLGKVTPQPKEPDHYADFDYTPEEKGWLHIPTGFESIEDWLEYNRKRQS